MILSFDLLRARYAIFRGLRSWRSKKYLECAEQLHDATKRMKKLGRPLAPRVLLRLLIASAISSQKEIGASIANEAVQSLSDYREMRPKDRDYLFLLAEAACQALEVEQPFDTKIRRKNVYQGISESILNNYPLSLLELTIEAKA